MNDSVSAIFVIFVGVLLFLILREFFCWYWKINKSIVLLSELNELEEKRFNAQVKSNEKLDAVCDELIMLRQQQLEISIKQENMYHD
jgi:hypothetical protein